MILDKINPVKIFKSLQGCLEDLARFAKYKSIIAELQKDGKLDAIGLLVDADSNLYIGVNLNPELLMYSETSSESVELKMISDRMKKYTEFLTKEGILDSVKVEYDRIKNEEYYGYILQITFDYKKYKRPVLVYAVSYFSTLALILIGLALWLF